MNEYIDKIVRSRAGLVNEASTRLVKSAEEGGCGVVGFCATVPVAGRHIFEPSIQMHNRGNGKGGGIACACLDADQLGVSPEVLRSHYLLQVAYLDSSAIEPVEQAAIFPYLDVADRAAVEPAADYRDVGLEVRPPDVVRYFVRVKKDVLAKFAEENDLTGLPDRAIEDEYIYQNSARLNQRFYTSLGDQQAFVMSHARDLAIFKIVGYAEQVVEYYGLKDFKARIWIAHQRYPTKGRVWHPGGAHPFIGLNEALVHNGDFANYHSVGEYLQAFNITPRFLTDTEVSVQLFDLWSRTFGYPLEYVIEAMAPTGELDLDQLPEEKQEVYQAIQTIHTHGSPDGPWFFIIARSMTDEDKYQLLGVTDTAMLRPQVFAIQEGDVAIGLIASEKQAIDATLRSLAQEDPRFRQTADRYWNARGGSYTDGGAFSFTLTGADGGYALACADKFDQPITAPTGEYRIGEATAPEQALIDGVLAKLDNDGPLAAFNEITAALPKLDLTRFAGLRRALAQAAEGRAEAMIELLCLLNDRRYDPAGLRRSSMLELIRGAIDQVLEAQPLLTEQANAPLTRIDWETRDHLRAPAEGEQILVVKADGFPPEGADRDSNLLIKAYELGWKRFMVHGLKGQRFHGCGLGPDTADVRIDLFGSSGDYLASGIDGMTIVVHDNAQDQLAQIMKQGRLVVHGDVGQAFMYGAKGGEVYVLGNGAGRPLINAVGKPRVVINGTCLDFLAESFMAGDPLNGGGFVVLNGLEFDDQGRAVTRPTPYPGSNLFSLASGGAIYVRDPHGALLDEQLNGGQFSPLTGADWSLIKPYLETNEELFGISVKDDLLTVDGKPLPPEKVYRKIEPAGVAVPAREAIPD